MKKITLEHFNKLLAEAELSKIEFAAIVHIPQGTVFNWGTSRGEKERLGVPYWVKPFMELYIKTKAEKPL